MEKSPEASTQGQCSKCQGPRQRVTANHWFFGIPYRPSMFATAVRQKCSEKASSSSSVLKVVGKGIS